MKKIFLISFLFILLSQPVLAQTISLSPVSSEQDTEAIFNITVNASSMNNLFGVSFDLDYNSTLISFVEATESNFLSQNCSTSLMTNSKTDKLIIGLSQLGSNCTGVDGSGQLMTLTFQANQAGTNNFTFSNNSLGLMNNDNLEYITGTWQGSTVTIGGSSNCFADINEDNLIDISDVGIMMTHWQENYSPADLNNSGDGDGVVDISDFGILMTNWGSC